MKTLNDLSAFKVNKKQMNALGGGYSPINCPSNQQAFYCITEWNGGGTTERWACGWDPIDAQNRLRAEYANSGGEEMASAVHLLFCR